MAVISDFANLSIGLSANPPSQANFGVAMLMVDHGDVPVDRRYLITSKSGFKNDLTSGTEQYNWCNTLWGQNKNPAQAYIGRWVSAASEYYRVFPNTETTVSVWVAAAAAGQFKITEGATTEDIAPDFTGDTTMAEVAASINAALVASTSFTTYTCALDSLDRMVITGGMAGSASPSFTVGAPAAGTDLSSATYLDSATSFAQAGLDAETLGTAVNAITSKDNTPFVICERGADTAEQVAFATSMNSLAKLAIIVVSDTDAKNSAISTDAGYQINALGYNKIHVEYTEWKSTQYPDAAICGEILPQTEATYNWGLTPLTGVSESGKDGDGTTVVPIDTTEGTALKNKGYDYLVKPATVTHFVHGLASGGNEMRIMFGKLYTEAKVNEDVYNYQIANAVVTFSDTDIQAIQGIIDFWMNEMVKRKVVEAGYTIEMPLASSFTAAEKATHIMNLNDLSDAETQRAVNVVNMSLTWSV
jgi:hypothetical protein